MPCKRPRRRRSRQERWQTTTGPVATPGLLVSAECPARRTGGRLRGLDAAARRPAGTGELEAPAGHRCEVAVCMNQSEQFARGMSRQVDRRREIRGGTGAAQSTAHLSLVAISRVIVTKGSNHRTTTTPHAPAARLRWPRGGPRRHHAGVPWLQKAISESPTATKPRIRNYLSPFWWTSHKPGHVARSDRGPTGGSLTWAPDKQNRVFDPPGIEDTYRP